MISWFFIIENCYTKVMDETTSMQQQIIEQLKLDPVDKEVIVLYKGEKERESQEFWEVSIFSAFFFNFVDKMFSTSILYVLYL